LNLIKAIDNLDVTLLIVGDSAPNHTSYLETCKAAASDKVQFIPRISQEELVYYYLSSAIHILPSWFETTGLSSLEAAYLGCKLIVSPNGDTRDYFGEFANYCDPSSVTSIQRSIETSLGAHYQNEVRELIKKEFNWLSTAKKTKQCYESIKIKE
jgi:glycosyltransferase involved in cell wall biosynthesis